jgi:hypothetical protein
VKFYQKPQKSQRRKYMLKSRNSFCGDGKLKGGGAWKSESQ